MPIIKYICEHCRLFNDENKTKVEKHEEECENNPAVRGCLTCKYAFDSLRYDWTACPNGYHNGQSHTHCEDWEPYPP